jgi:DNA topoisomerase-1
MKFIIVETSAQAKTLSTTLGEGWRVEPCYGIVRDLPSDELGVNPEDGFRPTFSIVKGKGGLVVRLKKLLREAEAIYAATPPGDEGEAMAWHVLALEPSVTQKKRPVYRVMLDALTPDVIREAFASPLPLDMNRVEAALAIRIANRLASVTVNKALGTESRLSYAGMVALRYLANHEVAASRQYWLSSVRFKAGDENFTAKILNVKGKRLVLRSDKQVEQFRRMLKHATYWVDVTGATFRRHPAPDPLTLTVLIERAAREVAIPPERTLSLISTLYESGRITHPDGITLAASTEAALEYVRREFGEIYLAKAEPAINGIAPVDVSRLPEKVGGDGAALYSLIWRYFVAAHMAPAYEDVTAALLRAGLGQDRPYPVTLLAQAGQMTFEGWMRVFQDSKPYETGGRLPLLNEGVTFRSAQAELVLEERQMARQFCQASLAAALIHSGFNAISAVEAVQHLQESGLVSADNNAFVLTEDGLRAATTLRESFANLTAPVYAEKFFAGVDAVAVGEATRADVLRAFWSEGGDGVKSATSASPTQAKKPAVNVGESYP